MQELLGADWGRLFAGTALIGGLLFLLRMVITASNWSLKTLRGSADFDHAQLGRLQAQVDDLNAKVDRITADYRRQRELKHDWRGFASSLIQERWTIRRFATLHDCAEVIELMDQLDDMRRDHPLMADVTTLLQGEPE